MKTFKTVAVMMLIAVVAFSMTACSVPANTVFNADDMMGKKIGVQLGTTGDIYVTDGYTNDGKKEGGRELAGQPI